MDGPFDISWGARVLNARGIVVATGDGQDDEEERKNAEMVCAALNAAYYMALATGKQS